MTPLFSPRVRAWIALGLSLAMSVCFVSPAFAQAAGGSVTGGLSAVGSSVNLTNTDPRIIVARVINVFLSLLAFVLLGIMLYAGFLWMTSGGNSGKEHM